MIQEVANVYRKERKACDANISHVYHAFQGTLFQNGRHFSVVLFTFKIPLVASFLNLKFKRIVTSLEELILQANKGTLKCRQAEMPRIFSKLQHRTNGEAQTAIEYFK